MLIKFTLVWVRLTKMIIWYSISHVWHFLYMSMICLIYIHIASLHVNENIYIAPSHVWSFLYKSPNICYVYMSYVYFTYDQILSGIPEISPFCHRRTLTWIRLQRLIGGRNTMWKMNLYNTRHIPWKKKTVSILCRHKSVLFMLLYI